MPGPALPSGIQPSPESTFWGQMETSLGQARRSGLDPWSMVYAQRFNPQLSQQLGIPFVGRESDRLRDVEHFLYAQEAASTGPMGYAQMMLGSPAHAALKGLGLKSGDASLEEVWRGWQGANVGLVDWLKGLGGR